ncbi:MAG: MBOAT family protein, partial [bacterium]|nr:MBOAT family protein [bacterium]
MVFSSVIFLFMFLPLTLAAVFLAAPKLRNLVILISSLIFYAWGEKQLVLLLLISIFFNYLFGLLIQKNWGHHKSKYYFILAIIFNLGLLGFFKYANFIVDNLNTILAFTGIGRIYLEPVHLPIGISFFTFQAMSYVIDIYRDKTPAQKNPVNLALYIALFPQLIAGPIIRYMHISSQLIQRKVNIDKFSVGIKRFIEGLGKKVLIANTLGAVADQIFALPATELTAAVSWLALTAYTLQIYFDFSGYYDMAIGLGKMLGFDFLENFNYPYISTSITEFWRRWHISLSTWLRDYLFLPTAYASMRSIPAMKKWHINTEIWGYGIGMMVTMFLGGLWHGDSWNFVIWGVFHGSFAVLERTRRGKRILKHLWKPLRHTYTLMIIMIGWVLFRSNSLPHAWQFLKSLAGFGQGNGENHHLAMYLDNKVIIFLILGAVFSTPLFQLAGKATDAIHDKYPRFRQGIAVRFFFPVAHLGYYMLIY